MALVKTFIVIHHIIFAYGIYLYGWSYIPFVLLAGFIFVRLITEEILHKGVSHGMYKPNKFLDWMWALSAIVLGQGSTLAWANIHRQHHTYTDTERDPQSVYHHPFWKVYAGIFYPHPENKLMIKDLMRSKAHVITRKWYSELHIIICLILALIDYRILVLLVSPGIVYGFHALGSINTFSHLYGKSLEGVQGRNLWWVSWLLCFTREQHADHHKNQKSLDYMLFKNLCIKI